MKKIKDNQKLLNHFMVWNFVLNFFQEIGLKEKMQLYG